MGMGLIFFRMMHPPTGDGEPDPTDERLDRIFAGACLALIVISAGAVLALLVFIAAGGLQ